MVTSRRRRVDRQQVMYGNRFSPYLMILPAMVILGIFVIWPMINLLQMSLYRGNAVKPFKEFLGLRNFHALFFVKADFQAAFRNTFVYAFGLVVLTIIFALLAAVWTFESKKLNNFCQTMFFLPHLVATLSCAFIWRWLFSSQDYGLFNAILRSFGLGSVRWLDSSQTAMICVIIMNTWKGFGYYALIIMTALKAIPTDIYEAAELDGASKVHTFFRITIPLVSPQLFLLLITITTGAFKVFDSVRIMTGGGPGRATQTLSMFIYDYAFLGSNSLGMGSAAGVVLSVMLMIITFFYFRILERRVHY